VHLGRGCEFDVLVVAALVMLALVSRTSRLSTMTAFRWAWRRAGSLLVDRPL